MWLLQLSMRLTSTHNHNKHMGDVIVSVLALSTVEHMFKWKTIKLVFADCALCRRTAYIFAWIAWNKQWYNMHGLKKIHWDEQILQFLNIYYWCFDICLNVIVSVFVSSAVYRGFDPWSGQTKDYEIGICCFSTNYAALRRMSKD